MSGVAVSGAYSELTLNRLRAAPPSLVAPTARRNSADRPHGCNHSMKPLLRRGWLIVRQRRLYHEFNGIRGCGWSEVSTFPSLLVVAAGI